MKAINLLPRDTQRSFGAVRGTSGGTVILFGALATALVLVLTYVVLANNVRSKRDELARVTQQVAATQSQVATLKPYADLDQLRQSLLQQVRTVAGSRFDWPTMLDRIARAFPADAELTTFNGTDSGSSDSGSGGGPTISLGGCTPSHDAAAALIDRLRAVKGVDSVSLQSSTLASGSAGQSGGCPYPETFTMTVQLSGPSTASTATTPATGATSTSATPATTTPAAPAASSTTSTTGGTP